MAYRDEVAQMQRERAQAEQAQRSNGGRAINRRIGANTSRASPMSIKSLLVHVTRH